MSAITVLKDNVPTGPFTRQEVAQKLQAGEMRLEDLAFVEGLSQWTPLRDVLAKVDGSAIPPAPPAPIPGATVHSYGASLQPSGDVRYAGFWLRVAAYILDSLIIGIPMFFISMIIGFVYGFLMAMSHPGTRNTLFNEDGNLNASFVVFELCVMAFSMTVHWLYYALQESSSAQATIGKRVIGLRVTDMHGQRIGFGKATGRFFGKILSGLILCVGYIMAGITEKKQALHDMIAGTLVVRRP